MVGLSDLQADVQHMCAMAELRRCCDAQQVVPCEERDHGIPDVEVDLPSEEPGSG
jgi:hypothetical protein